MDDISKDDILFQPAVSPHNMIYYGWDSYDIVSAFKGYIIGYKNATNAIFHRFRECDENNNVRELDTLCFPLIFLYRHTAELYLKLTYLVLKTVYDDVCKDGKRIETSDQIFRQHQLTIIWNNVKPILSELSIKFGVKFNQSAIEHYIESLDQYDRNSFNFRYPVGNSCEMIHETEKRIDIENLRNKMTSLFDYFNTILTTFTGADYLKL